MKNLKKGGFGRIFGSKKQNEAKLQRQQKLLKNMEGDRNPDLQTLIANFHTQNFLDPMFLERFILGIEANGDNYIKIEENQMEKFLKDYEEGVKKYVMKIKKDSEYNSDFYSLRNLQVSNLDRIDKASKVFRQFKNFKKIESSKLEEAVEKVKNYLASLLKVAPREQPPNFNEVWENMFVVKDEITELGEEREHVYKGTEYTVSREKVEEYKGIIDDSENEIKKNIDRFIETYNQIYQFIQDRLKSNTPQSQEGGRKKVRRTRRNSKTKKRGQRKNRTNKRGQRKNKTNKRGQRRT